MIFWDGNTTIISWERKRSDVWSLPIVRANIRFRTNGGTTWRPPRTSIVATETLLCRNLSLGRPVFFPTGRPVSQIPVQRYVIFRSGISHISIQFCKISRKRKHMLIYRVWQMLQNDTLLEERLQHSRERSLVYRHTGTQNRYTGILYQYTG